MAQKFTLVRITHEGSAVDLGLGQKPDSHRHEGIVALANYLDALVGGARDGKVEVSGDAAKASGTVTMGGSNGNVTINGVNIAFTGANDTARATDAAAQINASADPLVSNHVSATSAANVVTITSKTPGHPGNAITLAVSGAGNTASGARLAGGTETRRTYTRGI